MGAWDTVELVAEIAGLGFTIRGLFDKRTWETTEHMRDNMYNPDDDLGAEIAKGLLTGYVAACPIALCFGLERTYRDVVRLLDRAPERALHVVK